MSKSSGLAQQTFCAWIASIPTWLTSFALVRLLDYLMSFFLSPGSLGYYFSSIVIHGATLGRIFLGRNRIFPWEQDLTGGQKCLLSLARQTLTFWAPALTYISL